MTDAYRSFTYSTRCYAGPVAPGTHPIPEEVGVPKAWGASVATLFGVTEDALRRARLVRAATKAGIDTSNMQYLDDAFVFEVLRHIEEE